MRGLWGLSSKMRVQFPHLSMKTERKELVAFAFAVGFAAKPTPLGQGIDSCGLGFSVVNEPMSPTFMEGAAVWGSIPLPSTLFWHV